MHELLLVVPLNHDVVYVLTGYSLLFPGSSTVYGFESLYWAWGEGSDVWAGDCCVYVVWGLRMSV
jgi:hypothetical protein